ncbi:MAG: hypothetical protein K8W52_12075 [Deltaproteobacteria bacterium]|nr:hypothetical protein [Deltaproteobacteria bacterium]
MSRRPRTQFAAPFVMVVAACSHDASRGGGSSGPAPLQSWSVQRTVDRCSAMIHVDCPRDNSVTCNPPALQEYACPDFPMERTTVVSFDGKTCVIDGTNAPTTCPHQDPPVDAAPPPPPDAAQAAQAAPLRTWHVYNDGKTCQATFDVNCPRGPNGEIPPCNPPASTTVPCDLFGKNSGAIREVSADKCVATLDTAGKCPPGVMCNPPPPREIACPKW